MKIGLIPYEDLNFVELRPGGARENMDIPAKGSKYLNGTVFNLFLHAFELSLPEFEYFIPSSFDGSSLVSLRNHMQDFTSRISSLQSADELGSLLKKHIGNIDLLNELKSKYPDWRITWEKTREDLAGLGRELLALIDDCIDEDRKLWVKGY